jgi:hypothetical protein
MVHWPKTTVGNVVTITATLIVGLALVQIGWLELKPSRKKGTHRGGFPPSRPRSWIARASRFNDRTVDQTLAGTPS